MLAISLQGSMTHQIFIILPADIPTGPVKGAYALANSLVNFYKVTLVTVKRGSGANARIDSRICKVCLADRATKFTDKLKIYRNLLLDSGGPAMVVSLSFCLSADFLNIFCKSYALTCSSVRGNLFVNYRHDYGLVGLAIAFVHLFALRRIDKVIAMNAVMAEQIYKLTGRNPCVISNFIDEPTFKNLECSRSNFGQYRFIFLGSLTSRKQPVMIVRALKEIRDLGIDASLNYLGSGPEQTKIEKLVNELGLHNYIKIFGFIERPESLIVQSDVLVLPSLSEGISRAAMEALYLGVPCVLRDVDGNNELIKDGENGATFRNKAELVGAMLKAAEISRKTEYRECFLPPNFRQNFATEQYVKVIGALNEQQS